MTETIGIDLANQLVGLEPLLAGIRSYRDLHQLDWDIRLVASTKSSELPDSSWWISPTPGRAVSLPANCDQSRIITLSGFWGNLGTPCCNFEHARFGELAARHLVERGYQQLATVSIKSRARLTERRQGFEDTGRKLGASVHHFTCHGMTADGIDHGLVEQIRSHKPVGLYAVTDAQGSWLRSQVLAAGLSIPQELGLIGTGDSLISCYEREPFMSSVAFPWPLIGQEVARTIHHLCYHSSPVKTMTLRPYRVEARESTQARQATDPLVIKAVNWMNKHLSSSNPLTGACKELKTSANTLCRHFKKDLGHSPRKHHELMRLRRACKLLANSDLPIADIATLCGFDDPTYFGVCFKRQMGCSPTAYRMQ